MVIYTIDNKLYKVIKGMFVYRHIYGHYLPIDIYCEAKFRTFSWSKLSMI